MKKLKNIIILYPSFDSGGVATNLINFINYFPDFISKGLSSSEKIHLFKKYLLPGDVHYNKKGNKLIADKFIKIYLNQ